MNTDWQGYSGQSVQDFIKKMIRETLDGLDSKIGNVVYRDGKIEFYDQIGGTLISSVTLTGTSYSVDVQTDRPSRSLTVLTTDKEYLIKVTPTTSQMAFGNPDKQEFYEDYIFKLEVDAGNGYLDKTPPDYTIRQGETKAIDIRPYLTLGSNRLRITVTGVQSGQSGVLGYTASLTTMSLSCKHTWQNAWIEGQQYSINNIFFSGNLRKTLYVKIGEEQYTQEYSAGDAFTGIPTEFSVTDKTPSDSGVYAVEIWLQSEDGVQTPHVRFNIMYITAADAQSGEVSLICTNNEKAKAYNFKEETLLEYAVYNVEDVIMTVEAMGSTLISTKQAVSAGEVYPVRVALKIDTESTVGVSVMVDIQAERASYTTDIPVDNTHAYLAASGYGFYLNATSNSNTSASRTTIYNSASKRGTYSEAYDAEWTKFTFADDAWGSDPDGNRALVVKAGSELRVPTLKPLMASGSGSCTFEFLYRASAISEETMPIMTCINTETANEEVSTGFILYPTRLVLLGSAKKTVLFQQLPLSEDRIHHICVVVHRGYGTNRNLARIYINGCETVTFDFANTEGFFDQNDATYGYLRIGQQSTDTYLYMMRIYNTAISGSQVFGNYLNALIETASTNREQMKEKNNISDGEAISYDMCVKAGLNRFIVETDEELPSLSNQVKLSSCNIHLEYADTPEWNVSMMGVPLEKQGTTSSLYPKWNLRANIKEVVTWKYADGTEEQRKDGYIAGIGLNPRCSKITWKKNIASQPQGHKMGATAMYNDLWKRVVGTQNLPKAENRVAVYQYPFMGFQKFSDGTYKFIGLYTGGPDKTDKKTFGYNEVTDYPSLMMIEGPNHDPYLTRFLVPWTDDVFYDYANETLSTGAQSPSDGSKQEGWDADIVGDYSSDKESDAAAIFNLYKTEFKPAYDVAYYCSPYLASIAETGYASVDAINADLVNYQNGTTRGHKNSLLTLYNENYELVYFRVKTGRYEVLPKSVHDMLAYLGILQPSGATDAEKTDQFVSARQGKWKEDMWNYVEKDEALFRQCYDELIGASDNDAKNSYWRKFSAVVMDEITKKNIGGKWGFNEDDLDTIFQNDNNGQDTKEYYIEPDDVTASGADIFQGRTSAFWYALRQNCKDELRAMMGRIVEAMQAEASAKKLTAPSIHETVYNLIHHYFWSKSSKYFPAVAYNADTQWAYVDVWYQDPTAVYNNVPPLTQVHGDHYESEKAWVDKRIAYMFSKYQLGAFKAGDADGYGRLEITPAEAFEMTVTPAIWLYPRLSVGGAATGTSERTEAGNEHVLTLPAGSTGVYVKGLDWLASLGDLSGFALASRGGSTAISFALNGKRLRTLKVGDADASKVKFNATTLALTSPTMEEVDARNVTTLTGTADFNGCPRLRKIDVRGTNITDVSLPQGSRVEQMAMSEATQALALNNANLLAMDALTIPAAALPKIRSLYLNNCDGINPLTMLAKVYNATGSTLTHIGLVWRGKAVSNDAKNVVMLGDIAKRAGVEGGFGGLEWKDGGVSTTAMPMVSGTLDCTSHPVYISDVEAIEKVFEPNLKIEYSTEEDKVYVDFEDAYLNELAKEGKQVVGSGNDGNGITWAAAKKITALSGSYLHHNDKLERFNELYDFEGITTMAAPSYPDYKSPFYQCTALSEIKLPKNLTRLQGHNFNGCSSLKKITIPKTLIYVGSNVFANVPDGMAIYYEGTVKDFLSIRTAEGYYITSNSMYLYIEGEELEHLVIPTSVTVIPASLQKCLSLRKVTFHDGITEMKPYAFGYCTNITSVENFPAITSIPTGLFYSCSSLTSIGIPDGVTEIGTYAFSGCSSITEINIPESVTEIQNGLFSSCSSLANVVLPNSITKIGDYAFNGTQISELSLGENITSIGSLYSSQIKVLRITATTPPTLENSVTLPSKIEKIYVPDVSLNAYKTATYWTNKATLIFPLSQYVEPATE